MKHFQSIRKGALHQVNPGWSARSERGRAAVQVLRQPGGARRWAGCRPRRQAASYCPDIVVGSGCDPSEWVRITRVLDHSPRPLSRFDSVRNYVVRRRAKNYLLICCLWSVCLRRLLFWPVACAFASLSTGFCVTASLFGARAENCGFCCLF